MNTLQQKQAAARINTSLHAISCRYFDSLPINEIKAVIETEGFDAAALDGIYCGRTGRVYGLPLPVKGAHEAVAPRYYGDDQLV